MLLITLGILVSLSACNTVPVVADQEQCFMELEPIGGYENTGDASPSYEEQILQLEENGIDTEASYCGCRSYHYGKDYIGMTLNTTPYKKPLSYCHKTVGWKPDGYAEVVTYWQAIRNWILKYKNYGK